MNEKILGIIGIGICAVLLFGVFMAVNKMPAQQVVGSPTEKINTVSVSGVAEQKVTPDQGVIRFAVMTESLTAKNAEEENSRKIDAVMKALKAQGVDDKDIVTEYYNIYPYQEYEPMSSRAIQKGYRAQHTLRVTVHDIEKAGEALDAAVNAGVTNVDSVSFTLSEDREKEIREELIGEAATKARERAEALVGALGGKVGKVVAVSESGYMPPIYYARDLMSAKAESSPGTPNYIPDLNPEDITVRMQVNVEFAIE